MKNRMKAWTSASNDKDESLPETTWTSENTDVEKTSTAPLQRRLQPRHLQMLAIGGTVGTGLVCKILTAGHLTHVYMLSVLIAIVGRSCLSEFKGPLLTIEVHRSWRRSCHSRASRSPHRVYLRWISCLFSHDFYRRDGDIYSCFWSFHHVC
jgi:hypothetical protein